MQRAARVSIVLVVLLTVQTSWLAELRPFGVTGDVMLLVTIATAIVGGAEYGATIGFAAGICIDLVLLTPFGLSALTYLLVGHAVGRVQGGILRAASWIPVVTAAVATAGGIVLYVMLGQILGQHFRVPDLPRILLVTTVMNAIAVLPMTVIVRWAIHVRSGRAQVFR